MARQVEDVQALTLEKVLSELEEWESSVADSESRLEELRGGKGDPGTLYKDGEEEGRPLSREEAVEWLAADLGRDRAYVAELCARRDELSRQ